MTAITFQELKLKYVGSCELCDTRLSEGALAVWHPVRKTVRCQNCFGGEPVDQEADPFFIPAIDPGTAGASASRMYERRRQETWKKGAEGERVLGTRLDNDAGVSFSVLHDRRIPGSNANIDHLAVSAAGVWVIDAKKWSGRVAFDTRAGHQRVLIGGRNRTAKVKATLERQADAVARALEALDDVRCPIYPVMCLVDSEWPLLLSTRRVEGFLVTYPRDLLKRLHRDGPLVHSTRRSIAATLDEHLPKA